MNQSNVALLLTPPGSAAIAVVRLAGPATGEFLQRHFSRPVAVGRCVHGTLRDADKVLDDPVVVLGGGGQFADINLHGGPWVVRSVLELARLEGFAVNEKPELPLPAQAVDATGLEAQVIAYLPLARTELALRRLLEQPAAWEDFRQRAAKMPVEQMDSEIHNILADRSLEWLLFPPRVAIVGAPNVGKSTLANQLFAQERSITADLPGTTRDWVGEIANLDGLAVLLVDTPGLRETADPIEAQAIDRSQAQVAAADLLLLVLDPTRPLAQEQADLLQRFSSSERVMHVINKCDQPAVWDASAAGLGALRTVATTGQGLDELRLAIRRHFGCASDDVGRPALWTTEQREMLRNAANSVAALSSIFQPSASP